VAFFRPENWIREDVRYIRRGGPAIWTAQQIAAIEGTEVVAISDLYEDLAEKIR